ncbi:hypothetical protein Cni_G08186 [Canna indica]|uniref:Phytocyanin domain-containing protein n=1 Tax=Canna indica TaxID=4628 RepID=A0AAQ3Q8D3_9LILI|nr:hypothetical protein Cni_G08186 [Canna indica]
MASTQMLSLLAVFVAAAAIPLATAENFTVGDDNGWLPDVNYTTWAQGKVFRIGDNLIFNYIAGAHNVIVVGGDEFKLCNVSAGRAPKVFSSGDDVVPLQTTGKKWYFCGIADHCSRGQKLVIDVLPAAVSPAPSPAPFVNPSSPPASPPPGPVTPAPSANPPSPPAPPSSSWRIATDVSMMMAVAAAAAAIVMA